MTKYYSIIKEPKNSKIEIDYNKLNGFRLMPKNQVEYDGIMVNKLVLINQSFIERVLKKKIKAATIVRKKKIKNNKNNFLKKTKFKKTAIFKKKNKS